MTLATNGMAQHYMKYTNAANLVWAFTAPLG